MLINKHDENYIYQTEDDLLEYQINQNSIKNIPFRVHSFFFMIGSEFKKKSPIKIYGQK